MQNTKNIFTAFVSTNSICQGEQVGILWPEIYKNNFSSRQFQTFQNQTA